LNQAATNTKSHQQPTWWLFVCPSLSVVLYCARLPTWWPFLPCKRVILRIAHARGFPPQAHARGYRANRSRKGLSSVMGFPRNFDCHGVPSAPPGQPHADTLSPGRRRAAGSQARPMSALLLALQVALLAARRLAPPSSLASLSRAPAQALAAYVDTQAP